MRHQRLPLLLFAFVFVFACREPATAQEKATYSIRVNPDGESFSLLLDHTVAVVGGSIALVIDPEVVTLEGIAKGGALPEGALLFSNLPEIQEGDPDPLPDPAPVFDESGDVVPGGVLLGWSTAELDAGGGSVSTLPPGNDREIAVFLPSLGDGFDACAVADFVEGLRTTASGPLQGNIVTDEFGDSVSASAVDGEVCLGPEVTSVLAPTPASILIDNGLRAVAFAGSFTAPPLSDAELGRLVFQNVGAGDVATLVRAARLHADEDGDGVFTDADPALTVADLIDPETQEIAFADAGVSIPAGETLALFLVLELSEGSEGGVSGSFPPVFPASRLDRIPVVPASLVFFILLLLSLTARVGRSIGAGRAAPFAAAVLLIAFVASCGGGDGDGEPAAATSKGLQMQLVDADAGDSTGRSIRVEGVPITAWSF